MPPVSILEGLSSLDLSGEDLPVLGLKWQCAGIVEPITGRLLENEALANALSAKLEFTPQEWATFGMADLHIDDYVKSEMDCVSSYFKVVPAPQQVATEHKTQKEKKTLRQMQPFMELPNWVLEDQLKFALDWVSCVHFEVHA